MKKFLSFIIALVAVHAHAQMDSCNVFLQGNFVEVGVSPVGSYGSSTGAPAGYHGNAFSGSYYNPCGSGAGTPIGFIADPGMDGWSIGMPPSMGDYFLPGSPFEGWELQVSGSRVQAFNTDASGFEGSLASVSAGSNVSYSLTASGVTTTWQGTIGSVGITQVTTLDTGNLYFTMQVTLTNYSSAPLNELYYFRSLDPDNDQVLSGSYATNNTIASQGPDSAAVVIADGQVYGLISRLALGTTDTNARSLIYHDWPLNPDQDLSALYDGSYVCTEAVGDTDNGDYAIGLVYHIAHLASVDSAADSVGRTTASSALHPANAVTLKFFYAFSQLGLDSAISASPRVTIDTTIDTTTSVGNLAVKNVNATNIRVYPVPSANIINVSGLTAGDALSVVDMMGKETTLAGAASGNTVDQYSLSSFTTGSYILVVKDSNGNVKSRVSIQKK